MTKILALFSSKSVSATEKKQDYMPILDTFMHPHQFKKFRGNSKWDSEQFGTFFFKIVDDNILKNLHRISMENSYFTVKGELHTPQIYPDQHKYCIKMIVWHLCTLSFNDVQDSVKE